MDSRKIIVAGIGTEIGKSIVSAVLCEALKADYWKPVQAGDLDNSDSLKVKSLISNSKTIIHKESYKLQTPMSPHASADIDGIRIESEMLQVPETSNSLIIELAGGLMVPLREDYLNIDWIKELGLPVVLVANYYLGSINHTLLSVELLKSKQIPIMGLIFNGEKNSSSFEVIMKQTKLHCLLELPMEDELNEDIIKKHASKFHL